jgi:hypothetical protein
MRKGTNGYISCCPLSNVMLSSSSNWNDRNNHFIVVINIVFVVDFISYYEERHSWVLLYQVSGEIPGNRADQRPRG